MVFARLVELDWIRRAGAGRAITVTPAGVSGLAAEFGVTVEES